MAQRHVIDYALDLARMPAVARNSASPALPSNILELMRIAAACPEACQAAVARTGEPTRVLTDAARFYLQQVLFRQGADCYRILGIDPSASRATARDHMRWLMEWLHPDRNNNSLDAVYAERVLKAWREVSAAHGPVAKHGTPRSRAPSYTTKKADVEAVWVPWISRPVKRRRSIARSPYRKFILWAVPAGVMIIFLGWWSANTLLRP